MSCFEISPLCDFNIRESFCELARLALHRNGMERIWRSNKGNTRNWKRFDNYVFFFLLVLSLQELCCRAIVRQTKNVYTIDTLPLPPIVKSHLKSYALTTTICPNNLVNSAKNITCKSPSKFSAKNSCSITWKFGLRRFLQYNENSLKLYCTIISSFLFQCEMSFWSLLYVIRCV